MFQLKIPGKRHFNVLLKANNENYAQDCIYEYKILQKNAQKT